MISSVSSLKGIIEREFRRAGRGISFIEYMHPGQSFLGYTNLFSLNDYKKDDKIICKYFNEKYLTYLSQV